MQDACSGTDVMAMLETKLSAADTFASDLWNQWEMGLDPSTFSTDLGHLRDFITLNSMAIMKAVQRWDNKQTENLQSKVADLLQSCVTRSIERLDALQSTVSATLRERETKAAALAIEVDPVTAAADDPPPPTVHILQALGAVREAWHGLHEELERCKYRCWLTGMSRPCGPDSQPEPESPTTAVWRRVAARHDEAFRGCRPPPDLPPTALMHLGHLVDHVTEALPAQAQAQPVLTYLLRVSGWSVEGRASVSESPYALVPWLCVTSPEGVGPLFVDLRFRDKFLALRQSPRLAQLLCSLPAAFVGRPEVMGKAVRWCGAILQESFRLLGMTVPPWRTPRHLLDFYARHVEADLDPALSELDAALRSLPNAPVAAAADAMASEVRGWATAATQTQTQSPLSPFLSAPTAAALLRHLEHTHATAGCELGICHCPDPQGALDFEKVMPHRPRSPSPSAPSQLSQLLQGTPRRTSPLQTLGRLMQQR